MEIIRSSLRPNNHIQGCAMENGVNEKNSAGAVLLDGLTLDGAERLLHAAETEDFSSYRVHSLGELRSGKCDYGAYGGFRLGLDVVSLAQLVQTIVTADYIAYDEVIKPELHLDSEFHGAGIGVLSPIQRILKPLRLTLISRISLLTEAADSVATYLSNRAYERFLNLLVGSGLDGAFIQLSSSHFRTGLSDPLFDKALLGSAHAPFSILNDIEAVAATLAGDGFSNQHKQASAQLKDLSAKLTHYNAYQRSVIELLATSTTSQLLRHVENISPAVDLEFRRTGEDIVKHALAARFYSLLSDSIPLPYLPHPLRSSLNAFELLIESDNAPVPQKLIELMQEQRNRRVNSVRPLISSRSVNLNIPFFLALVMKEAASSDEILQAAMEIRESRQAREFRTWLSSIHRMATEGNGDLQSLSRERKSIEHLVSGWSDHSAEHLPWEAAVEAEVTLWFAKVTVKLNRKFEMIGSGRSRLRLLQSLADIGNYTQIGGSIERLFGPDAGNMWRHYARDIEPALKGSPNEVNFPIDETKTPDGRKRGPS